MKNDSSRPRLSNPRYIRTVGILTAITLIAASGIAVAGSVNLPKPKKQVASPMVGKCKADLAKRLKLPVQEIKVIEDKLTVWPDASLGMPVIDKMYAQVQTPGAKVVLQARHGKYLYTTSNKTFRYGGPTYHWSYSMLFLQPIENEPNLNGDLYQCSLLGTNPVKVASEVSDYYPQEKGVILFTRRTSRSGFDLMQVKADGRGKAKMLYQSFAFGQAAFNEAQNQWAAFVKPMVGARWEVVIGGVGLDHSNVKTMALPEDTRPGQLVWSGETLMIQVKRGDGTLTFETNTKAEAPEWKSIPDYYFPGFDKFILNKSETLVIEQVEESPKPVVEVALLWFTGDRNVLARIGGLTMQSYDLLGPFAFITGEKNDAKKVFSVDISSGEALAVSPGEVQDIKPFNYPPKVQFLKK